MNINNKSNIIMLPNEVAHKNSVVKSMHTGFIMLSDRGLHGNKLFEVGFSASNQSYQPQYLYKVSDENYIDHTDWVIKQSNDTLEVYKPNKNFLWSKNCRKIVATNDPSLINDGVQSLTQADINEFITNYNNGR